MIEKVRDPVQTISASPSPFLLEPGPSISIIAYLLALRSSHFCAVLCLLKIQLFLNAAPLNARKFLNRKRIKQELLQQVYGC